MFSDRLRDIRLSQSYTLEDVAQLMDGRITKQALSKYERGLAQPRPKMLIGLAKALGVKAADLITEPAYEIESLQYRTRALMHPRSKERVEASLRRKLERRIGLEDRLCMQRRPGLPKAPIPVRKLEDAEHLADRVRADWDLGATPIANLTELLESRAIHVFEIPGDVDFDGLAAVARDGDGELRAVGIAENPDATGDRQRFNLAHELGHVVARASDAAFDDEDAASRFAGSLLAPADLVRGEFGAHRSDVTIDELLLLKKSWGVSMQCILHRLRDVDVITQAHYEWWWREIDALGYRKVEPAAVPREQSTWERRNLARATAEGVISREQAAAYAGAATSPRAVDGIDRRSLARLSAADRHAVLREYAERLAGEYEATPDEWLEADLDEP
jgi:Zn-dependent peptidase ImmA (M78 family)/transcriptional regulator with XRE-family HTH domain